MPVGSKKKTTKASRTKKADNSDRSLWQWLVPWRTIRKWALRGLGLCVLLVVVLVFAYRFVNPPLTHTMWAEGRETKQVHRQWVDLDDIAPVMLRSVVAAEDANFCLHWGFDMGAIRAALREGAQRGGSTLSQQTVKNVFLWQNRSWPRKAIEAVLTPLVEAAWPKERILEVYLNVAEFGTGVFGVDAAAWHYFKTTPGKLTANQAARLAVILPDPKGRNAADLPQHLLRRVTRVVDGAATIKADGRASCFDG